MFRRLFGRDPADLLNRGERALAEGSAVRALEFAEKAEARGGETLSRARDLAGRARESAIEQAIEKAGLAESDGDWEDAADWIEAALIRVQDPSRQIALEERLHALQIRAQEADAAGHLARMVPEENISSIDAADLYAALIEGLTPEWSERLAGRSDEFRQAWVALNEGRVADAVDFFEGLAGESPRDPVARLERGRCRLLLGDIEVAQEDFAVAWDILGDEALDLAGHLSAPGLWAETTLELGKAREVAERLAPLADPEQGRDQLLSLYARALIDAGEVDSAMAFLARSVFARPGRAEFSYLLAQAQVASGDHSAAVETLELAVAPSCASGRCGAPSRHLASIRMLVLLHLDHGRGADRARELMAWVLRDQGGLVSAEDERLLERLQEA